MTSEQQLIIPVTGQELGEFLIGLLGQRRTIEKIFSIPNLFVSQDQILNTLDVVSQRLEQNRHSLVAFKCAYYFKSGKVLTVYDINDFNHFTDLSLDETVGIDMNLTYLVEFPNVSIPEKQDIRIQIFSDSTKQYDFSFDFLDASPLLKYTVSASNLTWGED